MKNKLFSTLNKTLVQSQKYNFAQSIKIPLVPLINSVDIETKNIPTETTTTPEELLKYYKTLSLWRRTEVEADNLYKQKEIRGFCHLYNGQEAIALGIDEGSTHKDLLITAYREHCQAMSRGFTPYEIIAEMMSRATGGTKGKGGSMHYYRKETNFYGGHGIVGAQIPMGTGLAYSLKHKKNNENFCITMFGDGSSNQGQFYESTNLAGLHKLPIAYVCENNRYGMGTSVNRASHHTQLFSKFRSIPGININGQCIFTVREWTKWAKNFVIKNGPLIVELDTYRYYGHSMSDPGISYRNRDEVNDFRNSKDCILLIKKLILQNNVATEKDLKDIDNEIRDKLEADIAKIFKDPLPEEKELFTELYIHQEKMFIRNILVEDSYHLNLLEN